MEISVLAFGISQIFSAEFGPKWELKKVQAND